MKKLLFKAAISMMPFTAFATVARAEAVEGAEGAMGGFMPIVGYLLFFGVVMYLLIFLPQKRKDKKAKELMNSLQVGHRVTTHSGIVGKVVNIKDDVITVESGVERTQLELKKWAIRDVEKPIEA
ncbi:MAG: preprotein translocase subunit YajC [Oscillospiraceae bacterium]|nr:preprotein translocase subunit YajC [Oscillospiraceae bacterium]